MAGEVATAPITPERPATEPAPEGWAIPPLIHQTFETFELPVRMQQAALSWASCNPAFTHHYHDRDARRALIETHIGPEAVAAYDKLTYGAFKADLWRYCQLYVTGGVYADIDSLCRTDLRHVIRPEDTFLVPATGNQPHAVFNAFICAAPGHPFLEAAIERSVREIHAASQANFDGYMACGPGALGAALNAALGRPADTAHRPGTYPFESGQYRILDKRPNAEGTRMVYDGDHEVMATKYEGYFDDLSAVGVAYWLDAPKSLTRRLKRVVKSVLRRVQG